MVFPVNARTWTFAALSQVLCGCAFHSSGLVVDQGRGVVLQTAGGPTYRLVTVGQAAPVGHLADHIATIDGRRVFRTVTVDDWKVHEGLHGMTAWVGELRWMGAQLGVNDRNSGVFYYLDEDAIGVLGDHAESTVLVEGYIVGPNRVKVLYFRVLE